MSQCGKSIPPSVLEITCWSLSSSDRYLLTVLPLNYSSSTLSGHLQSHEILTVHGSGNRHQYEQCAWPSWAIQAKLHRTRRKWCYAFTGLVGAPSQASATDTGRDLTQRTIPVAFFNCIEFISLFLALSTWYRCTSKPELQEEWVRILFEGYKSDDGRLI